MTLALTTTRRLRQMAAEMEPVARLHAEVCAEIERRERADELVRREAALWRERDERERGGVVDWDDVA